MYLAFTPCESLSNTIQEGFKVQGPNISRGPSHNIIVDCSESCLGSISQFFDVVESGNLSQTDEIAKISPFLSIGTRR